MGKSEEPERPPIDFERIDGEKLVEKSLFKLRYASEPMIKSLKLEDPEPNAKVWDSAKLMSSVVAKSGWASFKLSEGTLPSIKDKMARRASQSTTSLPSLASPSQSPTSLGESMSVASMTGTGGRFRNFKGLAKGLDEDGKRMKRSEQYFQLLMRAKYKKDEADRKAAEGEEMERAEGAARQAFRKLMGLWEAEKRSEGTTDSEGDDSEGEEDYGPLTAYDGQMKIDVDFVVVVPHRDEEKEDVFIYPTVPEVLQDDEPILPVNDDTPRDEGSSGTTTPLDFSDEMETLKVELKKAGKLDDAPKGIAQKDPAGTLDARQGIQSEKKMPNLWDNPYPEWSLETGGSMYFIPDAERYAWCPSLPPPPPPSMLGRRRLRLKPRLPLTLSNHRYKDEHPNIFPPEPFSPSQDHYASWEKRILTYDLYSSCVEALARLPPQEFAKDEYKHKLKFGSYMEKALRRSRAWKNWRGREKKRVKDEESRTQRERENEERRRIEKEKKQKAAEEALRLQEEEEW